MHSYKALEELAEFGAILHAGPSCIESTLILSLDFIDNYQTEFEIQSKPKPRQTGWHCVRVRQTNGSLAWSSPI